MKLALLGLAVAVLLGVGAEVPFSGASTPTPTEKPAAVRAGYVDTSRLLSLHPAWEALQEMKATLVEVHGTSAGVLPRVEACAPSDGTDCAGSAPEGLSRNDLEAEAARKAVSALGHMESELRQAVWTRANSMRAAWVQSARSGVDAEAREILASAEQMAKEVDQRNGPDRLNARIKLSALRAVSRSPGVVSASVEPRVKDAVAELERMEQESASEKQGVWALANGRIEVLREAAESDADAKRAAYERDERSRIEERIGSAGRDIMAELAAPGPAQCAVAAGSPARGPRSMPVPSAVGVSGGGDIELARAAAELERRIRSDVDRAVRDIAARQGVALMGDRRAGTQDLTAVFAGKLRSGGWRTCAPVLSRLPV